MMAVGFTQSLLHQDVTRPSWLIAAGPFSTLMLIDLYCIMVLMMVPKTKKLTWLRGATRHLAEGINPEFRLQER